jgi:hypothetical protein
MESARETRSGAGSAAARSPDNDLDENGEGGMSATFADTASAAARQAKKAASSLARDANDKMQEVLDLQVERGADLIDSIAGSIRVAADDLETNSPQLADLARGAADYVGNFSDTVRDQSASDLIREGADFARRQPAIVFGAAALLGFGLYRLFSVSADEPVVRSRTRSRAGQRTGAQRKPANRNGSPRTAQGTMNRGAQKHGA